VTDLARGSISPEDAEEYTLALGQVVAGGYRQVALGKRLGVPQALGLSVEDWVATRLGGYVRMSIADRREAVAELTEEGMTRRETAEILGVDEKTVRNDLAAESSAGAHENVALIGESQEARAESSAPITAPDRDQGNPSAPADVFAEQTLALAGPELVISIDEELLARQQRETLIASLDRAIYALESPPSAAVAEAERLLAGGDAGPFTPDRFERVIAYCSAFSETLKGAET
jgi:hypothetical protein